MFTYGGSNSTATPTGIHFVSTRVVIENMETVIGPPTPLQLYAICVRKISAHVLMTERMIEQEPQHLPIRSRVLGAFLISGKVGRSGGDTERHLGFDSAS